MVSTIEFKEMSPGVRVRVREGEKNAKLVALIAYPGDMCSLLLRLMVLHSDLYISFLPIYNLATCP